MARTARATINRLKKLAMKLPGAWEDHPWGETVIKVKKKVFIFLGHPDSDTVSFSVKLPESRWEALDLPFTKPTGYGLGKSGWVSVSVSAADDAPTEIFVDWLHESYRAVAPKTLVAQLDGDAPAPQKKKKKKKTTRKKKKKKTKKKKTKKKKRAR